MPERGELQREKQMMMDSSVLARVEALVEAWGEDNAARLDLGLYDMWAYNDHGLDYRDLLTLLAMCTGVEGDAKKYVQLGERSVKQWQMANWNQKQTINRLMGQRSVVLEAVKSVPNAPTLIQWRALADKIRRAMS